MIKTLFAVAGALAFTASESVADVATNKKIVADMIVDVFGARNAEAVDRYFTEDYIQRNPMIPSGSA
ncbi:MAG: nuclear transport factor 2 family protein, partial [Pseudomonadota bacterium]